MFERNYVDDVTGQFGLCKCLKTENWLSQEIIYLRLKKQLEK